MQTHTLNIDSAFNIAVQRVIKVPNSLFYWLTETWTKRWPTVSELHILDLHCLFNVEEWIQRLQEIVILSGFLI